MMMLAFPLPRPRQAGTSALDCRWRAMLGGALAAAAFALPHAPAGATELPGQNSRNWVGTWATAPDGPPPDFHLQTFTAQTVRLIVRTSIGGTQVRIGLSNEHGATPLHVGAAHVALCQSGAAIVAASDRTLTFGGAPSLIIEPGGGALSDPVDLDLPAMSDLAVSIHLPGASEASTIHDAALQTSYVSEPGDFTHAASFPVERTMSSWPFLTTVDVRSPVAAVAVVALGDSITDGYVTGIDRNRRWPDLLARRLLSAREKLKPPGLDPLQGAPDLYSSNRLVGVLNMGIAGDRLRAPAWQIAGASVLARFERDVLAMAGVQYLIVLIGINDIGNPLAGAIPTTDTFEPEYLIEGYRELIALARARGIAVYGATLTPFEDTIYTNYYTPEKELVRQAVNQWIRSSGQFDAVIDFERALADPGHPGRMRAEFDSGDHLHPNELGMQAMADAIPLGLFRDASLARAKALWAR